MAVSTDAPIVVANTFETGGIKSCSKYMFIERTTTITPITPPTISIRTCCLLPYNSLATSSPSPLIIQPVLRSYPISAKHGPTADTNPVRTAIETISKPKNIPIVIKIVVIAKAGNHPECIAAWPTKSIATKAENVAQITHKINFPTDILETTPVITAIITAVTR